MITNGKVYILTFEDVPDIASLLVKMGQAGIIDRFEISFEGVQYDNINADY